LSKKILLVDDDLTLAQLLKLSLVHNGYVVDIATDGEASMRISNEFMPDVVVLDIIMPGQDGIELLPKLKNLVPQAKIIVVSGGAHAGPSTYLNLAKALGADMAMAKPFSGDELIAVIEQVTLERG
jgi:DNA-binding response OmpR family regulator